MSNIYNRFLLPIIKFLIIAFAKLCFDNLFMAMEWKYSTIISYEAFFVFCYFCFRYITKSKKQQEEKEINSQFNSSFFKNIHYKIYNSPFKKFLNDNKLILVLLFLSGQNLLSIIEVLNKDIFQMFIKVFSQSESIQSKILYLLLKLREDQNLINYLYSCYFCFIVWIFNNRIEFQLLKTESLKKGGENDKKSINSRYRWK